MKKNILILFASIFSLYASAQNLNDKINLIFNEWNQPNHPGGVVSIMKKDQLIFSKAYGLANIKYNIQNKTETIFNIGSVSKQFTAMGIVLLHLDNKLSIDDDICKYLPELKGFNHQVTIRHLLHHTSGIRSTPELFGLAGWRDGDAITTDDDYRYLCKQTHLNFEPDSEFMYSNSGYILLAKIIETVTQQNFNEWMKENIFIPLNMTSTFVDESNSNSNANIATPYMMVGEQQYIVGENSSLDIGASNIYSSVQDLTVWMQNFYKPSQQWAKAFSLLKTTDTLINGTANNYAYGVFVDEFFGNKRVQHTGGVPGYLTSAMCYPEEELTIVLLTNFTSPQVNHQNIRLTQLFLKNKQHKPKPSKQKPLKPTALKLDLVKNYSGDYWNDKDNYARKIYFKNDTLWYQRTNGSKSPLIPIDEHKFQMGGIKGAIITVKFNDDNQKKMIVRDGNNLPATFVQYDSTPATKKQLQEYVGSFYSPELETTYLISLINGNLIGYHHRHGEFYIELLKKNVTSWSGMAFAKYKRNINGKIIGISVSLNRINDMWFIKNKSAVDNTISSK